MNRVTCVKYETYSFKSLKGFACYNMSIKITQLMHSNPTPSPASLIEYLIEHNKLLNIQVQLWIASGLKLT